MIAFFETISNFFISIANFIGSFFMNLINGIAYMVAALTYLGEVILFLPPVLTVAAAAVVAIAVIHFLTLSA